MEKAFDFNENEIKEEELINIVEIAQINKGYNMCLEKQSRYFFNLFVDQRKCHQRIIYENQLKNLNSKKLQLKN